MALVKDYKVFTGAFLLLVFAILVYSFNYHFLWLLYDVAILLLIAHYLVAFDVRVSFFRVLLYALVFGYFLLCIASTEEWMFGLLSMWDTFKHLILFNVVVKMSSFSSKDRYSDFALLFYRVIIGSLCIQFALVFFQYFSDYRFDDISGSFGDGGSHAIGYISLASIISVITMAQGKSRIPVIVLVLVISILMNFASENAGFFVLMLLLLGSYTLIRGLSTRYIFILILAGGLLYVLSNYSLYSESSFGEVIVRRTIEMFDIPNHFDTEANNGRADYLYLSYSIGGWFGVGPGAYSNIYLMQGYEIEHLVHQQINIAESSHLIAESGLLGFVFTVLIYMVNIFGFYRRLLPKVLMSVFFIVCMFYSALLMNETHIFMVIIVFYFIKIFENKMMPLEKRIRERCMNTRRDSLSPDDFNV